ncbi:hypothetical protein F5B22DRAFT_650232 [Xylaria bambusicola]|uniref:uncharacterized protein n=1 Tax=Xylaria bambusicola TaxID=326684 RepID=UPI002007FCF9|nr:uncharacterized protein F5B22DRAFT_650232 [Xylaria bambusicola]KAI0506917.1 hypothetical protein F5B22DRAFT_650232 [Xylaria bambusicola]
MTSRSDDSLVLSASKPRLTHETANSSSHYFLYSLHNLGISLKTPSQLPEATSTLSVDKHAWTMYAPQGNSHSGGGSKKSGSGKRGGSGGNSGGGSSGGGSSSGGKGHNGGGSRGGGSSSHGGGKKGGSSGRDSWEEAAREREMQP